MKACQGASTNLRSVLIACVKIKFKNGAIFSLDATFSALVKDTTIPLRVRRSAAKDAHMIQYVLVG